MTRIARVLVPGAHYVGRSLVPQKKGEDS